MHVLTTSAHGYLAARTRQDLDVLIEALGIHPMDLEYRVDKMTDAQVTRLGNLSSDQSEEAWDANREFWAEINGEKEETRKAEAIADTLSRTRDLDWLSLVWYDEYGPAVAAIGRYVTRDAEVVRIRRHPDGELLRVPLATLQHAALVDGPAATQAEIDAELGGES